MSSRGLDECSVVSGEGEYGAEGNVVRVDCFRGIGDCLRTALSCTCAGLGGSWGCRLERIV